MGTPTPDIWIALQAATVAIATSWTFLSVAVRIASGGSSLSLICRVAIGGLPIGIGLWCTNLIGLLATPQSHALVALAGLAPLPIAVLGAAAALWIVAGGNASPQRFLVSGATLAATACTVYAESVGELSIDGTVPDILEHVGGVLVGTTLTCSVALRLYFAMHNKRSAGASLTSIAAVLFCGIGFMWGNVDSVIYSGFGQHTHHDVPDAVNDEVFALAITVGVLAILSFVRVLTLCEGRLATRVRRHAREIEEVRARLHYTGTHDTLTGLPNLTRFKERLAEAVADTERSGRAVAVAVLDLDRFSSLNHSLGYGAGDWLLAEVARRVASLVPPQNLLARVGSDEFVVLIDSVAAGLEAESLMNRIVADLQTPICIHGTDVYIHPSVGVSVWPDHGRRIDDLFVQAEVALGQAKEEGGNTVRFFRKGMDDSLQERLALENDLRRAVKAGEFELWFQPELSVKSGRIVAAEALLRWRHPVRGLVSPSLFIPLAEATGLIIPLGEWVLREACRQARAWQLVGGASIRVAVNLSANQFRHSSLVEVVKSALQSEGLGASRLEVELTESAVMLNPEDSIATVKQLRKMGVTVAIDDFGTGYSSLSYLRRFRIDKLKIDRSFVRDLTRSGTDKVIVRAIVRLAHTMGLDVVAEGVETEEQLQAVRGLGCDTWQGFYCCEPQPAEVFARLLAAQIDSRTAVVAALGSN
jgi:diguanylate cyclase (GGDEF)-like protein